MAQRALYKHMTYEDKFDRKYWVHNRAKRKFVKFLKHNNNNKLRRICNKQIKQDMSG